MCRIQSAESVEADRWTACMLPAFALCEKPDRAVQRDAGMGSHLPSDLLAFRPSGAAGRQSAQMGAATCCTACWSVA